MKPITRYRRIVQNYYNAVVGYSARMWRESGRNSEESIDRVDGLAIKAAENMIRCGLESPDAIEVVLLRAYSVSNESIDHTERGQYIPMRDNDPFEKRIKLLADEVRAVEVEKMEAKRNETF